MAAPLSRDVPLKPGESALLIIDVQNYCAHRDAEAFAETATGAPPDGFAYFFEQLEETVIPNIQRLQRAFRAGRQEVLFTVIESLTRDGRDRSLDYKITGFNVPRGSWDAQVIDPIAPEDDEIVVPKTSSSVFISTNIDYLLRNLGIRSLVVAGVLTDQCVESAVRDACDLGYLVTLVTDACATFSRERQENSLGAIRGYCRQMTAAELLPEIPPVAAAPAPAAGR